MLRNETGTPGFDLRQNTGRRFDTHDRAEGIDSIFSTAFQYYTQMICGAAHIVAEKQMGLVLDRRRKDIQVTIVVKIGKHARAAIGDRIDPGNARDIHEFLIAEIQIQRISFVTAEGETLPEHQTALISPKGTFLVFSFIRLRHDLTPKLTSGVLHRLAGYKAVWRVDIFPAVVVKIYKSAAPCPAARKSADFGRDVSEFSVACIFEKIIAGS